MTHHMRLDAAPFALMQSGQKTIELRLFDEKRQQIQVGDWILFENRDDPSQVLHAVVEDLHIFPCFEALYRALPLDACGYTEDNVHTAKASDMNAYYTQELQEKYGVVGIQIRRLV